ncbi:hypothetical protein JW916_03475 [Candidatus Sumerlaeota bacterium]|nr:hypothetical protein [Candidatus Sumerlaeota bacterium]
MRILWITIVFSLFLVGGSAMATEIVVAQDGSGDFKTIQEAIIAAPDRSYGRTTIRIKPGTYEGHLFFNRPKVNVTLLGEDANTCIISYGLNVNDPVPEGQPAQYMGIGVLVLGERFEAENLTFQNTAVEGASAIALQVHSDRAEFRRCRILGRNNTLRLNDPKARQYLGGCYIEGGDSFISGDATAVFDRCEIHSRTGGYIAAPKSSGDIRPYGFVFIDCSLTGGSQPVYLGQTSDPRSGLLFINCAMGAHIRPEGWDSVNDPNSGDSVRFGEFLSSGSGATPERRVAWANRLTRGEAAEITVESVVAGKDGWKPSLAQSNSQGLGGAKDFPKPRTQTAASTESGGAGTEGGAATGGDTQGAAAFEPLHAEGYVTRLNAARGEVRLEEKGERNTLTCHANTWVLTETSGTLASIPSNYEVSVLGRWLGDTFRFQRVRSFVVPALPPQYLGDSGASGFLIGDVDNLSLRTPLRTIPVELPDENVVVMRVGNLSQIAVGQRAEVWGRSIEGRNVCDVLLVYGLSRRSVDVKIPTRRRTK